METPALRPCPFCAHDKPELAMMGNDDAQIVVVTCFECGAIGPRSTGDDPPGHAAHLRNQRFGVSVEH
jgi:hypothetical protein